MTGSLWQVVWQVGRLLRSQWNYYVYLSGWSQEKRAHTRQFNRGNVITKVWEELKIQTVDSGASWIGNNPKSRPKAERQRKQVVLAEPRSQVCQHAITHRHWSLFMHQPFHPLSQVLTRDSHDPFCLPLCSRFLILIWAVSYYHFEWYLALSPKVENQTVMNGIGVADSSVLNLSWNLFSTNAHVEGDKNRRLFYCLLGYVLAKITAR